MIYLAWCAFGLALVIVGAVIVLVRGADDEFNCQIDEELLETDLRHELSDISFGRRQ